MATPRSFAEMTNSQLRTFINGCHRDRAYDEQFRAACAEMNRRDDAANERDLKLSREA